MMRRLAGILVVVCLLVPGVRAQEAAAVRTPPPAVEQIARWISELGANQFDVRDRAMQSLIAAGKVAIPPVLAAARGTDREVALRCVVALQEIGARGDIETLQLSLSALDQVAQKNPSPAAARQAVEARATLSVARQERAVEYLQRLGAVVTREAEDRWYQQAALFRVPVFVVEIGPQWRGADEDLERLSWITDVEQVNFVGPRVKDSWFAYLKNLPRLNSVKIKRAAISNQGLTELAQLEGIWFLRLMFVPLDDSAVPILENSKSLRRLLFISRQLSDKGIQRLQDRLGKDNVECPRGALLGITANVADGLDWTVSSVLEGSAAAKAGIVENDRIVKYNGQPVTDFPSLKALISQNEPGDTVMLEIERGLDRLTKPVTFGEWD